MQGIPYCELAMTVAVMHVATLISRSTGVAFAATVVGENSEKTYELS